MTEHDAELTANELAEQSEQSEQKLIRLAKRDRLLAEGEAYPVAVPITTSIAAVRTKYENLETDATTATSSVSPAASCTPATPASSASPVCRPATASASRPW